MDSKRWSQIQTLFEQVLEMPAENRQSFLQEKCANDDDLYNEVTSLINADDNVHELLEGLAIDTFIKVIDEPLSEGSNVGPYTIVKKLAAGGMGYVYLAKRSDGHFEQETALKILKKGLDSQQVLRRFEQEKQILARLNHPNIARLLDAGLTDDGRPWFSMEYIDGLPITRFCDHNKLTITKRLRLFQAVCETVAFAHRNLVVHRDLKPSNIMVTNNGEVKLLDFGISKVLEEENHDQITLTGQFILTPEYAAPEQFSGGANSVSSDIYQLGVVLYELIKGKRPFNFENLSPIEIHNKLLLNNPEPLDNPDKQEIQQLCVARSISENVFKKELKSDLSFICRKALRKEPELRYLNADELKKDINKYLRFLPVSARQGSFSYAAKKYLRRNRTVLSISVVFLSLIVTIISYYATRLASERDTARLEAEKAIEISKFLSEIFEVSDPSQSLGEKITARELLDKGAQRIKNELKTHPETQAALMYTAGNVYLNLGLIDQGGELIRVSLKIRKVLYGDVHKDVSLSLSALTKYYLEKGEIDSSELVTREKIKISKQLFGELHPDVALGYNDLALIGAEKGDLTLADSMNRRALEIRRQFLGEEHMDVAESLNNLGSALINSGRVHEAESLFLQSLEIRKNLIGDEHPLIADIYGNLGLVYAELGAYQKADSLYNLMLQLNVRFYGDVSPKVAWVYQDLAYLYGKQLRYREAIPFIKKAVYIREVTLGPDHILLAYALDLLADAFSGINALDSAGYYYQKSLNIYQNSDSSGWIYMASPLKGMGTVLFKKGRYREALGYFREALKIREGTLTPDNYVIARAQTSLAQCLIALRSYEEAESLLTLAKATFDLWGNQYQTSKKQTLNTLLELYSSWPGKEMKAGEYNLLLKSDSLLQSD
jgi:serine/threonine-protein kinase